MRSTFGRNGVLAAAAVVTAMAGLANAAVITWNFDNVVGASPPSVKNVPASSGTPVNFTVSDLTGTSNLASQTGVFNNAVSTGYTGATGVNCYGFYVEPVTGAGVFEMTFTPDPGYTIRLSDLDFGSRSTATGPLKYTVRWSADGYAGTIYTAAIDKTGSTWKYYDSSFAAVTDAISEPVTVRVTLSDGTGSSGSAANSRIDDLAVTVSAELIPEPASLGLLASAGLPLVMRRRRQA